MLTTRRSGLNSRHEWLLKVRRPHPSGWYKPVEKGPKTSVQVYVERACLRKALQRHRNVASVNTTAIERIDPRRDPPQPTRSLANSRFWAPVDARRFRRRTSRQALETIDPAG